MLQQNSLLLSKMYTPAERRLLEIIDTGRKYCRSELEEILNRVDESLSIEGLFRRGIISLCEVDSEDPEAQDSEKFCAGTFLGRLDIFATQEYETYSGLPEDLRYALDEMYFNDYLNSLGPVDCSRPTDDEVLPVEEVLAFIDGRDDTPYLADCDCRSLKQACDAPRNVCITYRTGPGSYVRRGLAAPISKEEAKEVVRRAESEGLIHTVNSGGICSCCRDCCYLFRAADARGSIGVWPKVSYRAEIDENRCIGCGICKERCRFEDTCIGCGVCISTCPADAIKLIKL